MKKVKVVVLIGLAALGAVYAGTRPEDMTREQKNKLLVDVAIGAMNEGDWELMAKLYSPKFVQHWPGNQKQINWKEFELSHRNVRSKMPTIRIEIVDIIAEGNKVAARLKTVVTYKATKYGFEPRPGKVEFFEMDMYRIEGGRIVEEWCEFDTRDVMVKAEKLRSVKTWK